LDPAGSYGGVIGTADNNNAGYFENNGAGASTLHIQNDSTNSGAILFEAQGYVGSGGLCFIDGSGDLACSGAVSNMVKAAESGREVETYSMQSPENWMEDFGTGTLQKGVAVVAIDPAFAGTVTADASYHVFITPNGDSEGLFVINKTATSFEVRESKGGISSLTFDYRIVAKRRGYEARRLTDVTDRFNAGQARAKRRMPAAGATASKAEVEAHMVDPKPVVTRSTPRLTRRPGGGQAPNPRPIPPSTRPGNATHSELVNHPEPVAHP
jgi:hypothetical protein